MLFQSDSECNSTCTEILLSYKRELQSNGQSGSPNADPLYANNNNKNKLNVLYKSSLKFINHIFFKTTVDITLLDKSASLL